MGQRECKRDSVCGRNAEKERDTEYVCAFVRENQYRKEEVQHRTGNS